MNKYVRVMDGLKSNAGGFEYKLNEVNIANNWNPNEKEPDKMGGFNFGTEDKILRWLHRGDTIYDVIIPEDAEVILCNEEKGIWRSNKIIVKNPRVITDEMVIELYKKTTLSNKILAQCLQTLLWKKRLEISKFIINDRVNKENVDEFIKEFEEHANHENKNEKFNYDELGEDSKIVYDMLKGIKEQNSLKKEKSCGCIIINDNKVLLIYEKGGKFWGFPKGHMEAGENEIDTALREVKEEVGLEVEINSEKRYTIQYTIDNKIDKTTVLFVAYPKNVKVKMQESEIENFKWCEYDEAMELLTFDNWKEILKKIKNEILDNTNKMV